MRNERLFRVYPELREAVADLADQGHSVLYLSRRLSIPDATIYLWKNRLEAKKFVRECEELRAERDELMALIKEVGCEEPTKLKRGRKPQRITA